MLADLLELDLFPVVLLLGAFHEKFQLLLLGVVLLLVLALLLLVPLQLLPLLSQLLPQRLVRLVRLVLGLLFGALFLRHLVDLL